MNVNDLLGRHGVPLDQIIPLLTPYEGLEEIELTSQAEFKFIPDQATGGQMLLCPIGSTQEYRVDFNGYKKAMRLAGFSESVVTKYPPQVMMEALNWGFQNRLGDAVKAFVKYDHLIAFVKPSLELVSTEQLVRRMYDIGASMAPTGQTPLFERLHHDLQFTSVSMLIPFKERGWFDERLAQVGNYGDVNDIVCGGVSLRHSVMGEVPMEVNGYVYRLTCSNGMISAETKFKWSRKTESVTAVDWFGDRVQACIESLDHEFDKIDNLINIPVPEGHRANILTNVFREYELSEKMRQQVMTRLMDRPARNMWDVVNAITNVANDDDYQHNPHTIAKIQAIGGHMSTKMHVCPACDSVTTT